MEDMFGVLANEHRRRLLEKLADENPQPEVPQEFQDAPGEIQMVHQHLPMLEEAGYIRWDRGVGEVSKGPRFDEVRQYFTEVDDMEASVSEAKRSPRE